MLQDKLGKRLEAVSHNTIIRFIRGSDLQSAKLTFSRRICKRRKKRGEDLGNVGCLPGNSLVISKLAKSFFSRAEMACRAES